MNKLINFNSMNEFKAYRQSKATKALDSGSEGTCYLGRDGLVYKDLSDGFRVEDYLLDSIITSRDICNKSFAFPHVLFSVGDRLVGYTTDFVKKDFLNYNYLLETGLGEIDFDKLIEAYNVMLEDTIKLAEDGISIYDLSFNLMFDGKKLVGVDTCSYYMAPSIECFKNVDCLDDAIKVVFSFYTQAVHNKKLDTDMEVIPFLRYVQNNFTNQGTNKGISYTKKTKNYF